MKQHIWAIAGDTLTVMEKFKQTPEGEIISYDELSEAIGRDIRKSAYYCVTTARRKLLNEEHMVFAAVRNQGYKRLTDVDKVELGEYWRKRILRASGNGIKAVTSVDNYDALSDDKKVSHNKYATIFVLIRRSAKAATLKKIEIRVRETTKVLPLAKTLEVFGDE